MGNVLLPNIIAIVLGGVLFWAAATNHFGLNDLAL